MGSGQLDIGGVFDATTELWKKTLGTVWLVAAVIMIPAYVIMALLGNDGIAGFVGTLVNMVASAWLAGSVIRVVQDAEADGRVDASVGDLLGSVAPKLLSLILLTIVLSILIGIGFILLIVPGVILALMWLVSLQSMVVEDLGVFDSMSRSSDLTHGNRMRILGVGILLFVAVFAVAILWAILTAITPILGLIAGIALAILVYPWVAILTTVLYFRLRELKEGAVVAATVPADDGFEPPAPVV